LIDFLKIFTSDLNLIHKVYNNPLLSDYSVYQKDNKHFDIVPNEFNQATETKQYKGIYFCFYERKNTKGINNTKLEILFKPHYYFNDNKHNANDFTAIDCINVLNEFQYLFELPINELSIINIEFGLNFLPPYEYKDIMPYIYYHERNLFLTPREKLRYSKISYKTTKKGTANQYKMFKFYAKGLQFNEFVNINTLRYEVKSKKSKYIKKHKVNNYADLLKFSTYVEFAEVLIKEFDKILIIDIENNGNNLNTKELEKLNEYLNPIYWDKTLRAYRNKFSKEKTKYFKLLDKTGNNIHTIIKKIIVKKLDDLLIIKKPIKVKEKIKRGAISHTYIMRNCTYLKTKYCIITGVDITAQKENSFLLSIKTINKLYYTDKIKFEEIKNKYLSKKWINADIEKQIFEIYHNIRNKASNARIKQNRLYTANQFQLF